MQIPSFPEANHPLVKSLSHYGDQELLALFQKNPDAGQYFTAIFCRYSPLVYTLIANTARSPVQADYLFAQTWRHVFYELNGLELPPDPSKKSLQSWLLNVTANCVNTIELPPVEEIHYSLDSAPPPLWCYVERSLGQLSPLQRLMVLMSQTYHWSETRIAAYLQAEGEYISPADVKAQLVEAYRQLETGLPEDISTIYLERNSLVRPVNDDSTRSGTN
ncbi:RNA polymerase sigma factor [Leptolyngbya sp. AN02str]|uniref:RNA polymerase sigma factor n=1 Tax=Leptolyngbya sp. AN02str TaxID=3423363 RepID=UPI003D316CDB